MVTVALPVPVSTVAVRLLQAVTLTHIAETKSIVKIFTAFPFYYYRTRRIMNGRCDVNRMI